jgi:hypothetical protein
MVSMAVATLPLQRVAMQSVISRGLPAIVARSPALVSVAPKLQLQRWKSARRVAPLAAMRGITPASAVVGSLGFANAGSWGKFAGLRMEHVGRKKEFAKTKRTFRTVASAEARDGRVRCLTIDDQSGGVYGDGVAGNSGLS